MKISVIHIAKYLLILLLALPANSKAQYDPLLTQYMFNPLILNPAYAGTNDVLSAMFMTRHQWVGFEDAPSTQTFSIHTPVLSRNFGTGLSLIHDNIGPVTNTTAWMDYSYKVFLTEKLRMSLGLKAGFSHYQKDLSRYLKDVGTSDPTFQETYENRILPNFGFGVYLYQNNFYAGLSMPRLLENSLEDDSSSENIFIPSEQRLYLLMAGYALPINRNLILRPSFMVRATESAPINYDVNINLLIKEQLWVGALYRSNNIVGGMVGYRLTQQLSLGYAFDTSFGGMSSHFGNTHEAMINFEFDFRKEQVQNPRHF